MNSLDIKERSLGINFRHGGEASVLVWAPKAHKVEIALPELNILVPLEQEEFGYWRTHTYKIDPRDHYKIVLNGKTDRPDPASLLQPEGVHGPSQAFDLKEFVWTEGGWKNPDLEKYILYELHTGTFTPGGNFASLT